MIYRGKVDMSTAAATLGPFPHEQQFHYPEPAKPVPFNQHGDERRRREYHNESDSGMHAELTENDSTGNHHVAKNKVQRYHITLFGL